MTDQQVMTRAQMDALVDGHYRAEEAGDLDAIVEGFTPDAEHDVVGRPGDPLHGGEQIAGFYRSLFTDIDSTAWSPCGAGTATTMSSTRQSCTRRRWADRSGSEAADDRCKRGS